MYAYCLCPFKENILFKGTSSLQVLGLIYLESDVCFISFSLCMKILHNPSKDSVYKTFMTCHLIRKTANQLVVWKLFINIMLLQGS